MEELSARENLFQLWMIHTSKNDEKTLAEFIQFFIETHKGLIDHEFSHLNEGFSEEGPHLTCLPDGILEVFGNQLNQCGERFESSHQVTIIQHSESIVKCLIVICRNYDNVPLVASCQFVSYVVTLATAVIEQLCSDEVALEEDTKETFTTFIHHVLHFLECLYDPYFIWRKRDRGWKIDKTRLKFRPALLHVEVIPFFHECFQKANLTTEIQLRLLHLFGAIMSGAQHNALKAITPATLDVLLKIIGRNQGQRPTNEQRHDMLSLRALVLRCIVRMVHVIHCCSPDQRQVEVGQVMEGYLHLLLNEDTEGAGEEENQQKLNMIGTINEMMTCRDKGALQVTLINGGTFDAFVSLLQKTPLTGSDAQTLAMSVLGVMNAALAGSPLAKEKFRDKVGYTKFVDALKSLGQPSMELLQAVLGLVVEGDYEEDCVHRVHNTEAALMLLHWLPDIQSHQLQIWLSENLYKLCSNGNHNRMSCCSGGLIGGILNVLSREKQINATAVCHLINLLEALGKYSITSSELKHLIGLLRLDEEDQQNAYCSRLMRSLSTMARRDGKEGALQFIYIHDPMDNMSLRWLLERRRRQMEMCQTRLNQNSPTTTTATRLSLKAGISLCQNLKKWPGSGFSFHSWVCLDTDIDLTPHCSQDPQLYRRQLYMITTGAGCGFEAFFTPDCNLVVAVFNKKECSSVTVSDFQFKDQCWHSIHVVHSSSRRPFAHKFEVSVYIDGKLVLSKQLKFPSLNEPNVSCRIGAPMIRNSFDPEQLVPPVSPTAHDSKSSKSPIKSFFQTSAKSIVSNHPGVSNIPGGTQDDIWGVAIPLIGQIGSVCLFCDSLQEKQVEGLHLLGPNHHHLFKQDSDLSDLPGKLVLHYNAKACKEGLCADLSQNGNHGKVTGKVWITWDIKDVINSVGGIQVLYPLLEQVGKAPPYNPLSADVNGDSIQPVIPVTGEVQDGWVVIPSSSYADAKLEQNQVAGFLTMIRHMLQTNPVNQDTFIRTNGAATIGALLQQVSPKLIDVHVMMAVQLLVLATAEVNQTILQALYQYVLFDFRIWSKSEFPVRIGHIQYLSTFIKDDRKSFRKKYGVQYILDVIRSHYSNKPDSDISAEDAKTIRGSLLGLIRYYVHKDITYDELSHIIGFLTVVKDESLIVEVLDVLIGLMEKKGKQDQLFLLLFEPEMSELLYCLLTVRKYSVVLREKVLKVIGLLLRTDKVYEKSKSRLRLMDCGYSGLINLMEGCEVSMEMIKSFLEQVSLVETPHSYSAVLSIIQLIPHLSVDIKLEASRQVLSLLVSKPSASKTMAKQLSWQEALTSMLILMPSSANQSSGQETLNASNPVRRVSSSRSNSESDSNYQRQVTVDEENDLVDFSSDEGAVSGFPRTPSTPMYLSSKAFDFMGNNSDMDVFDEERARSMSRSSSASVEDLSNTGARNSSSSLSLSSYSVSESSQDPLAELDDTRYRRPSVVQAENFQKALDNLGIQKIYVNDALEKSEELCQNLLIILLTVMWKGVEGSDRTAWKERCQVFACLNAMSENYELVRPVNQLKRRLLEMMLHSCTSDLRDSAQANAMCTENAITLTKVVHNFIVDGNGDCANKFSDRLIEDVMTLLDVLCVWETTAGTEWTEMVHMGFGILLLFAKQQNLELCAVATAKLHQLIQTRVFTSSAEASYLIGSLNDVLTQATRDNTDNYSFLIPVMKALIERAFTLLNLEVQLPTLPATTMSPTFFDDFKMYAQSEEWTTFICTQVDPQSHHFQASHFDKGLTAMAEFWADCHEAMMVSIHKRNREKGESKLKFQSQIMEPFKAKATQEQKRFQNIMTQQRNQYQAVCRHWRATKRFFFSERGPWAFRLNEKELHWKLSNHENFSRMKVKLVHNYNFDIHEEASRLRDNQDIKEKPDVELQSLTLAVSKEAKVAQENLGDDVLGDEDWNVISSASNASEEYSGKEKLVLSEDCELVTLMEVVKGRLEVTTTHVYFFDCSPNKEEGGEDFKWGLSQLREIHFRRYNLRRSALEMFLIDQTNYFINFQKKVRNKVYSRILSLRPPNLTYYGTRSPAELLKASGLTQKWVHREISNFDYLMQLNTIAGRTYNDLSQYPVFPWILSDYSSESLDLSDPQVYRDLSKPVGIVNPKNEKEVREKYDTFEDPTGMMEKFHYGTHYSNAAGVMHYMLRMEPFTTLHIQLQGGRFDVADRQFHSIPSSWHSLMENPNDVKELIPEFFYLPEFLINSNNFDLGKLQITKQQVDDVELPKWATSPADFIHKHRNALESEIVSANLHSWIDLIFGYKQKGPAAVEALNVFFYCTYEGAVDLDAITDEKQRAALEGMINNFGQTPTQLLKEPHPRRMSFNEMVRHTTKIDRPLSILNFLSDLKAFFAEVSSDLDPLVFVKVPRSQQRSIIQHGMPDSMITVTGSGILGVHGWLPYDKSISNYFTFQRDPSTITNSKTKKIISGPFAPDLKIEPKLFVVSHDAKLLFSGGHWDNSLQVYNINKGKKLAHIVRHTDVVTCLALDYCGRNLITGSRDTTCMVWQIPQQKGESQGLESKPMQILYGHDAAVTCVHMSMELDLAVSASKDGNMIIHTVRKGHYTRTLRPPCSHGNSLEIPMMVVSNIGHMVIYCKETDTEEDSQSNAVSLRDKHSIHLYSINGHHLFEERLAYPLGDMMIAEDYLLLGNIQGQLIIKEVFGFATATVLPLHVPIQCMSVTNNNSHILVGLKDGKLIIVGMKGKSDLRCVPLATQRSLEEVVAADTPFDSPQEETITATIATDSDVSL